MERWVAKVASLFIIWVALTFTTAIPIKVSAWFQKKGELGIQIVSSLTCFGGGVFLGTYLTHQVPDVIHIVTETIVEPNNIKYPVPEALIGAGFFMMLFAEKILLSFNKPKAVKISEVEVVAMKTVSEGGEVRENGHVPASYSEIDTPEKTSYNLGNPNKAEEAEQRPVENGSAGHGGGHGHSHEGGGDNTKSIILILALTFDHLFEGMALGLKTTTAAVWNMFIAILFHEVVIAFSLGIELTKINPPRIVIYCALFYGITCPIGITIGTVLMETVGESQPVMTANGVLQAMSAGVFVYVTFFEILGGEVSGYAPWYKIFSTLAGVVVMAALAILNYMDDGTGDGSPGNETTTIQTVPMMAKSMYRL